MTSLVPDLRALVDARFDEAVDVRREVHAHPELAFEETETTTLVRRRLGELGLEALDCPTPTGAVARLRGGRPGRTVLLRADIDALPLLEELDVPYRSRNDGAMHACGHDGHTAILLGVAGVLAACAEDLPGSYVLLFQPAEELGGGARAMIDGGVLDGLDVDRVLSLHLSSHFRTGLVALRPGVAMAAVQALGVHLHGAGGHGALGIEAGNVILALAALTTALPTVVEGQSFEDVDCVCSAGLLRAGSAPNVIPRDAALHGTLRTFTREQQEEALARLDDLTRRILRDHDVTAMLDLPEPVPAVVNDAAATAAVRAAAERVLGEGNAFEVPPMTPGDDVSEFLLRVPGCHYLVGGQPGPQRPPMHHAPDFTFDEEALRIGMLTMAEAAVTLAGGDG